MITRSKLVEQLRDLQIHTQYKCSSLTFFSPKPHINTRADVVVAIFVVLVYFVLIISFCLTLYLRHFWLSSIILFLGILLSVRLRMSRQTLAKKRERRLLLPLSM